MEGYSGIMELVLMGGRMTNVIPLVKKSKVSKIDIQMQVEVLEDGSLWYRWCDPKTAKYVEWRKWED